jgi:hypothetical protein
MRSSAHTQLLRWLGRIYGLTLLAYPSAFRREYGREMAMVFRNRARDVVERSGGWALVPFLRHVGWDWFHTTLREHNMTVRMPLVRWLAALPLAMLAAYAAMRAAGFAISLTGPRTFHYVGIWAGVGFFSMAAAFVGVGVWVAPGRKDSVARIAVTVVGAFGAYAMALGAFYAAFEPMSWGACILLGGVAAYLPCRLHRPSQALGA